MPVSLSPLSEAKAQLSLKTVALEKHYKQELKTIEAELNALNEKKQLLEAKRETVRCKIKEIADLGDAAVQEKGNTLPIEKSNKDDDDEKDYLISSIIHNDRDAAELKDISKQMLEGLTFAQIVEVEGESFVLELEKEETARVKAEA